MRVTGQHRWIGLLGWIADRPRGSAIVAVGMIALLATLIRAPVIEGSMVDQLSGSNARLEIERRISAAEGGETTIAIIFTPRRVSIGLIVDDLARLQETLSAVSSRIIVRSVDAARDRLFVYDLDEADPIASLLGVLRENPESATSINQSATRFLAVISLPEALDRVVLDLVDRHAFGRPAQRPSSADTGYRRRHATRAFSGIRRLACAAASFVRECCVDGCDICAVFVDGGHY
jgi:hypothetical protein